MKRRLLSILLAAVMLLSAVPLGVVETAWAADGRTMSKGYDAKGVTAKAFAVASSSVTG